MKLFRDVRRVTSSGVAALLLTALRALVVLRILGPAVMGVWKSAMVLYPAAEVARLGVLRGMSLRVPLLAGQGREEEAGEDAQVAGGFVVLVGLLLACGILVASFLVEDARFRVALRLMAPIVLLAQPLQLLRELAAAHHRFAIRSREMLVQSSTDFAAALALSWLFGLSGVGTATLLSVLVPVLYLARRQRVSVRLRLDLRRLRQLVHEGLRFWLMETALHYARFLDVVVIGVVLGPVFVGYYGVSLLILEFAAALMMVGISQTVAPHLLRDYGRGGSFHDVAAFYEMPTRLFCYVLPPVLGTGTLLLPEAVRLVLPQYAPGIAAAQIALWGIFFMAVHAGIGSFLAVSGKVSLSLRLFAALIPTGVLLQFLVLKSGYGLEGVALVGVVVLAVGTTAEICIARRACGHQKLATGRYLLSLYFPLGFAAVCSLFLSEWDLGASLPGVLESLARVAALLLCYSPLLAGYESQFGLLRTVRESG